ncbi:MAG TPA: patatin-like phospholipase family protein [Candidatus Baltobacteraceae bacterium]|nr:patatin-like phospholipase family protein [Candidatus Baltobacteraceae bacterium]
MKALVLSGGGAHGAYEAGVAHALMQRESFDFICGVSIGAINAALLSTGEDGAIEHFWHHAMPESAPRLFPHIPRLRQTIEQIVSIGSGNALQDAMRIARAATLFPFIRNLGRIHHETLALIAAELGKMLDFSRRRHALLVGATNITRGSSAVFQADGVSHRIPDHRAERVRLTEYHEMDAQNFVMLLLASSAMPGLFSPIELTFGEERALYADGCIIHNSPLALAIDHGATEITVVLVDPEPTDGVGVKTPDLAQMAHNIATLWQQRMLDYELRLAYAHNEILRLGGDTEKRPISIRHVRPKAELEIDMLAFDDAPGLSRLFDLGMRDGALSPLPSIPELPPRASADRRNWLRRLWQRSA